MRKIFLLSSFFFLTPIAFILSFVFLFFVSSQKNISILSQSNKSKVLFAALPDSNKAILLKVEGADARVEAVKSFLSYYKSPLLPFAQNIVEVADKYDMDYRLIPAIAMEESTLCKNLPAKLKNTHNCWGFGIYGKKVTSFDNYGQAIDVVTKTLAKEYKGAGLNTPEEIMSKYNPASLNGSWANGVSGFMDRLSISL